MTENIDYKFRIVECADCNLKRDQVVRILEQLPFDFFLLDEKSLERHGEPGKMDVHYSGARVIGLYPPEGMRLSRAHVNSENFPLRLDNLMDDDLGVRCCFHPKLTSFGIPSLDNWDEVEIDIHKYPISKK